MTLPTWDEQDHEHLFQEEQEPGGRLVLPPCLVCGMTAFDALTLTAKERESWVTWYEAGCPE